MDFDIEVLTSISVYSIYRYRRLRYRKFCSLIRSCISGRCRLPTSVACCSLCTSVCNSSHSTANQGSFHVGCSWAYASPFPWPPSEPASVPWPPSEPGGVGGGGPSSSSTFRLKLTRGGRAPSPEYTHISDWIISHTISCKISCMISYTILTRNYGWPRSFN